MRNIKLIGLALLLTGILSACSLKQETPIEVISPETLEFHIGRWWEKPVWEANLGYTVESSWPLLQEWYPTEATLIINLNDIESYNWKKHEMWLTPEASAEFASTFEDKMGGRIPAFVVTAKEQPIYGGVFLYYPSAMGIQYPVIYTDWVDKSIRFTIRPWHSIFWQQIGTYDWNVIEDWNGIDDPVIKKALTQAGKLGP